MTPEPDLRRRLMYHLRMLAISVVCAGVLLAAFVGFVWLMLSLGVWHIEDR